MQVRVDIYINGVLYKACIDQSVCRCEHVGGDRRGGKGSRAKFE